MRITAANLRTLGPGEHRDAIVPGLILRVWATGRAWSFRYTFRGRRARIDLGPVEREKDRLAADIERARDLARLLVAGLVRGEDPRDALRRHRAGALTVADLCRRMVDEADLRDRTRRDWRNIFKRHIEETPFGAGSAAYLSQDAIDAQCAKILKASGGVSANRFFEVVRRAYSYGMERRVILASPFAGMKAPFRGEKRRGRYLSREELARLMTALDRMPPCGYADATRLLLYTVKRRSQVETSAAREWHLDGPAPYWITPHENPGSKGSPDDKVALSTQAASAAHRLLGLKTPWLLPNRALDAHGEITGDFIDLLRDEVKADRPWSLHCLRATFATHAQELFRADLSLISVCLGHVPTGIPEATRAYALSARLEEKRELLQKWADWLDSLHEVAPDDDLIDNRTARKIMGLSETRMSEHRSKGIGAPFRVILRKVYYRRADVEKWRDERAAGPTVAQK